MIPELRDVTAAQMQAARQRVTGKRLAIVDVLATATRPLTIPEILTAGSGLTQSSVYRNLQVLEQAGVVRRIVASDQVSRYELAEELAGHHHHLVCSRCGTVEDVPAQEGLEDALRASAARLTRTTGFQVRAHSVDFVGLCGACA